MCDTREGAADILEVRRAILKWYPAGVGEVVFQDGRGFGDIPYISDFAPFLLAPSGDAVRDGPATLRTSCELDRFAIDCKILP